MPAELQLNDPETLYRRWEESQWSPYTIDLSADQVQWPVLGEEERGLIYFVLGSLMVAEERITTKFSGLVAAPSRSMKRGTCSSTPGTTVDQVLGDPIAPRGDHCRTRLKGFQ